MNNMDYQRLLELKRLIDTNSAARQEKIEYIDILYRNGNITTEQYKAFIDNQNADDVFKAALTIGGILLATWLISKLID